MTVSRIAYLTLLVGAVACRQLRPEPIAYGADECGSCRMQISDPRFGGEIVTRKGRAIKFDAIDCLRGFYKQADAANDVASVWVLDARHAGVFIAADSAWFIDLGEGRSPMGHGWAAIANRGDAAFFGVDPDSAKRWASLQ